MEKRKIILLVLIAAIACWWILAAPPNDLIIGKKYEMGEVPDAILAVESTEDILAKEVISTTDAPGHDDVVFQDSTDLAFLSGMDGWIWQVNRKTNEIQQFAKTPLIPTGMQIDPKNKNRIYFCVSRMGGTNHAENENVGLYELNTKTKKIEPVILQLPIVETNPKETTFAPKISPTILVSEMDKKNSRAFCLCNDLAISKDGERIYLTEPVPLPRAAMGSGAVFEAIGLASIGKLWRYNKVDKSISLLVDNFTFVDGLVLSGPDSLEEAVLFTETTKFRVMKTYVSGQKVGITEVLWENLPGMPDGMDRDANGNIWIGLIKKRSKLISWMHKNPWIKPFFLRIPQDLLPISMETGILALSPDGKKSLFYSMHDGSKLTDISVVSPKDGRLYFPVFNKKNKGWYHIDNPIK